MRSILFCLCTTALLATGCNNGPKRVAAPKLDAKEITDKVMSTFDSNSDGVLDESELESAPSLAYSLKAIDTNENGQLETAEIQDRFATYVRLKIARKRFNMQIRRKGRPLPDATVEMVPAPFMEGLIAPANGVTEADGVATMDAKLSARRATVNLGFYRIKVNSDKKKIAAKYNEQTTLGVEVAPVADSMDTNVVFDLK